MATSDGRLINGVDNSNDWGDYKQGCNWLDRIMELVSVELLKSQSDQTTPN